MKIIKLKYDYILPLIINAIYPIKSVQVEVKNRLEDYGKEDFHFEPKRVRLAILKFAHKNPDTLNELVDTACSEYRDILYFAETPLSMALWGELDEDPQKEKELEKQDNINYVRWLEELIQPQRK
jgi:hypothetical protein